MFVVDTNVLLYAADRNAREHEKCRRLIQRWRKQSSPWYLTWSIVYEFLRAATHPRVFRNPFSLDDAWSFIEAVPDGFQQYGYGRLHSSGGTFFHFSWMTICPAQ